VSMAGAARRPCDGTLEREREVFFSRCAQTIAEMDVLRRRLRFRRALVVEWDPDYRLGVWKNMWGAGHLLMLVFRVHELCLQLRRYCYVRIYDAQYEKYFAYPDGSTWDPADLEVRQYGRPRTFALRAFKDLEPQEKELRVPPVFPESAHATDVFKLIRGLAANHSAASLLHVSVRGWVPFHRGAADKADAAALRAALAGAKGVPARALSKMLGVHPCVARYVTTPLRQSRLRALPPIAPTTLHFRTGLADAEDAVLWIVSRVKSHTAAWVRAACGADPFADGARRFLLSDSPGLLRHFATSYPHVQISRDAAPNSSTSTRTWIVSRDGDARFAALDDIVYAGLSSQLQLAPQRVVCLRDSRELCSNASQLSSFYRPIAVRSMCVQHVVGSVPECPAFPDVFIRDLPARMDFGARIRRQLVRTGDYNLTYEAPLARSRVKEWVLLKGNQMRPFQPCRNLSLPACYRYFAEALM